MAVSRRFETRFLVAASKKYLDISGGQTMSGTSSYNQASDLSRQNIGIPPSGYAFMTQYNSGAGDWFFLQSNRFSTSLPPYYANNGLPLYPDQRYMFDHATWGRVPGQVTWYDGSTPIMSLSANGYYTRTMVVGARTIKYSMYISWYHQVNVVNNSTEEATVWARGRLGNVISNYDIGGITMTPWYTHVIAAGATKTIGYYEPLEIKIKSSSLSNDAVGVTTQGGSKYLILRDKP